MAMIVFSVCLIREKYLTEGREKIYGCRETMSDELSKEELLRINLELVKQNNRLSHDNKIQKQTIEEYKKSNRDLVVSSQQIIRQARAAQSKSQMAQEMLKHEEKKSEKLDTENKKLIHDLAKQHKTLSGRIIDLEQMLNLHLVDSMTPDEKSKKITALMKELAEKENQLELEKQKLEKEVKEKEELKRRLDAVKAAIGMENGSDTSSSCFESEFSLPLSRPAPEEQEF